MTFCDLGSIQGQEVIVSEHLYAVVVPVGGRRGRRGGGRGGGGGGGGGGGNRMREQKGLHFV